MMNPTRIFCFISIVVLYAACRHIDVFEKQKNFTGNEWKSTDTATGSFTITDTASFYKIYIVLRHTDAYRYNNIWINAGLQSPGDTMYYQKIDLGLGSDAQGWEGTGLNDIWEVRKQLNDKPSRFKKSGTYRFSLVNIMRDDPLKHVMSAGLRIEKAP